MASLVKCLSVHLQTKEVEGFECQCSHLDNLHKKTANCLRIGSKCDWYQHGEQSKKSSLTFKNHGLLKALLEKL